MSSWRHIARRATRAAFLLAVIVILAVPGLGAIAGAFIPGLGERLAGTVQEAPRPLAPTPGALASSAFQRSLEDWASAAIGWRDRLVHINSLVNWELFAIPPKAVELLVVGRDKQLYEAHYVDEFCRGQTDRKFDLPAEQRIEWLAATLGEIGDGLARSGKSFVVLISPSKPAVYPEDLPQDRCQGEAAQRLYTRLLPLLADAALPLVDGAALTRELKAASAIPVFNRYGTHWNLLGAYPAARDLLALLARQSSLPEPNLDIAAMPVSGEPISGSNDLAVMMGLESRLVDPQTPHPKFVLDRAFPVDRRLIVIGGSFLSQIVDIFWRTRAFAHITYYFATIGLVFDYRGDGVDRAAVGDSFDWRQLADCDAVVVELNEILAEPRMDRTLASMVMALRAAAADPT